MSRSLYLLNLTSHSSPSKLLTSTRGQLGEIVWQSNEEFIYLNQTDLYSSYLNGTTTRLHSFPFEASGLQYHSESKSVFFTAQIWEGSTLENVTKGDKAYNERGYDAEVFDELYIRYVHSRWS